MSVFRRSAVRTIVLAVLSLPVFGQHQEATPPERDAQSIEILRRVVQAAGGLQALAAVHDLTESGKITFHWGEGHTGPVTIRTMGTNHFRMEANLPKGKQTWLVNDGNGTIQKPDQNAIPFSNETTVIGKNLNFPTILVP